MFRPWKLVLALMLLIPKVLANVEKVMFLAPDGIQIPTAHPNLEDLQLQSLSPESSTLRTHLEAKFPTDTSEGEAAWFLLENLTAGQRYEVRICWAAIQPTAFKLETFELSEVFESPELITSLALYAESMQLGAEDAPEKIPSVSDALQNGRSTALVQSALFLQVIAAADYYTMNRTLMKHVEPVHVDIILDPYLLNILPRSLIPTGVYIIALAIGAWYISKLLARWIHSIVQQDDVNKKAN